MEELKRWIKEDLPNEGEWWDESNMEPFIKVAGELEDNGQRSLEYIKELLQELYSAVSSEFGS